MKKFINLLLAMTIALYTPYGFAEDAGSGANGNRMAEGGVEVKDDAIEDLIEQIENYKRHPKKKDLFAPYSDDDFIFILKNRVRDAYEDEEKINVGRMPKQKFVLHYRLDTTNIRNSEIIVYGQFYDDYSQYNFKGASAKATDLMAVKKAFLRELFHLIHPEKAEPGQGNVLEDKLAADVLNEIGLGKNHMRLLTVNEALATASKVAIRALIFEKLYKDFAHLINEAAEKDLALLKKIKLEYDGAVGAAGISIFGPLAVGAAYLITASFIHSMGSSFPSLRNFSRTSLKVGQDLLEDDGIVGIMMGVTMASGTASGSSAIVKMESAEHYENKIFNISTDFVRDPRTGALLKSELFLKGTEQVIEQIASMFTFLPKDQETALQVLRDSLIGWSLKPNPDKDIKKDFSTAKVVRLFADHGLLDEEEVQAFEKVSSDFQITSQLIIKHQENLLPNLSDLESLKVARVLLQQIIEQGTVFMNMNKGDRELWSRFNEFVAQAQISLDRVDELEIFIEETYK